MPRNIKIIEFDSFYYLNYSSSIVTRSNLKPLKSSSNSTQIVQLIYIHLRIDLVKIHISNIQPVVILLACICFGKLKLVYDHEICFHTMQVIGSSKYISILIENQSAFPMNFFVLRTDLSKIYQTLSSETKLIRFITFSLG